jgi:hypothetical protein
MLFLFQIGAVLLAGWFVALASTKKPRPSAIARSIIVVVAAFAYVAFWGHVWQNGKSYWSQRAQWRLVAQPELAGVPAQPGFQTGFAEWIRERIKPGDHFFLVSGTPNDGVYQWFTFRLLPSLMTEPQQADWLIFYDTNPRASGLTHLIKGVAEQYGPGYSIARTQRAS